MASSAGNTNTVSVAEGGITVTITTDEGEALEFKTSEEALKVAELVRSKLERGTFPPTISEEELQKLGISWRN